MLFAAYLLDPHNRTKYLTESAIGRASKAITRIALKFQITKQIIDDSLASQLSKYCLQVYPYDRNISDRETAYDWWTSDDYGGVLQKVALRISLLKSSSANIERTFSSLKYFQGNSDSKLTLKT